MCCDTNEGWNNNDSLSDEIRCWCQVVHFPHYKIPFPNLHIPTPSFSCVSWARCPEPKSCYLIQLNMLLCTLPPNPILHIASWDIGTCTVLKLQGKGGIVGQPITPHSRVQLQVIWLLQHACIYWRKYRRERLKGKQRGSQCDQIQMSIWAPNDVPVLRRNEARRMLNLVKKIKIRMRDDAVTVGDGILQRSCVGLWSLSRQIRITTLVSVKLYKLNYSMALKHTIKHHMKYSDSAQNISGFSCWFRSETQMTLSPATPSCSFWGSLRCSQAREDT